MLSEKKDGQDAERKRPGVLPGPLLHPAHSVGMWKLHRHSPESSALVLTETYSLVQSRGPPAPHPLSQKTDEVARRMKINSPAPWAGTGTCSPPETLTEINNGRDLLGLLLSTSRSSAGRGCLLHVVLQGPALVGFK